jgi:ATP-dependent RNA helicase RhlE
MYSKTSGSAHSSGKSGSRSFGDKKPGGGSSRSFSSGSRRPAAAGHSSFPARPSTGSARPYSARPSVSGSRPSFGGGSRGGSSFGRTGNRGGFSGGSRGGGSRGGMRRGERIDISKFIHTPTELTLEKKYAHVHTFADFKLDETLQKNLEVRGYKFPTEIQDKIIPHGLAGNDLIGLAHTGSGKTAAFLLPLIQKVLKDKQQKVIILAPTRELAQQINKELLDFSKGMNIYSTVCVGGMPIFRQIASLKRMNHFVIGTPGRLKDLSERGVISFSEFHSIVLDEVDRMLDMGFVDDMTAILRALPAERQAFFFSATMPDRIKNLINTFLKNPKTVDTGTGIGGKNVTQDIVRSVTPEEKFAKLQALLRAAEGEKSIIFVEMKSTVDRLARELQTAGFKVGLLHGDRRQRERERTLNMFKGNDINVLVATDVAARGIDVKDVFQVINYTIPQTHDDYVHRIGRTGRAGKVGKAFTFVN